ncbi:MAG: SusC/RagA family TonB-linked outer membrane protein [Candidatus Pseudobacter hemicellulosilyticus]|uniref:SusC/RagA family TonB-linked outer membrane protein n=1 Tax=Candidatus Pseudobacter hemicellulosilyticus TaxID=3121375 RepID=A0AAJ5WMB7_9BACT|nr:MAG: SusC/RagA family TonB-linked outer membrane protein [Pseudobacter sp.]
MRKRLPGKPRSLWLLMGMQLACLPFLQAQDAYAINQLDHSSQQDTIRRSTETGNKPTLFKVLKELNKTKGVFFLYADQSLGDKLVNPVRKEQVAIEKILQQVLENTGLSFRKVNEKTFVILAAKESSQVELPVIPVPVSDKKEIIAAGSIAITLSGRVADSTGAPIAGVSITVKGSSRGTTTSLSGHYSIEVQSGETLVFSAVGYSPQEVLVADQTTLNITLEATGSQLTEVVVTALGINRRARSITYATQKVSGEELTAVKDPNLVNSLNGKVAGLTVNRSASGAGGSVKVVMRGNKSTQNNSPLYVIDGIPMYNFALGQPDNPFGESNGSGTPGRDGGDAISNINPEDIESIQVLKGASAAALYGSQAANGALLITTRKGRAGTARIALTSSVTLDQVAVKPEAQFSYGQSGSSEDGWGDKNGKGDYTNDFYRTGVTWINGVSLTAGSDRAQTYFSYANTSNKNVIPTSEFHRHTFTFRETARFLDDKLTVDGMVTLTKQKSTNRPSTGFYNNPQLGLYYFPRNLDFGEYKDAFEVYSPARQLMVHNWWNVRYDAGDIGNEYSQNPYWILNRNQRKDNRDRAFSSLTLRYALLPWLNVQARGSYDAAVDGYESRMFASTHSTLADYNGRFSWESSKDKIAYGDLLFLVNRQLSPNLTLSGTVGASINDARVTDKTFLDSYRAVNPYGIIRGLAIANIFNAQNILSTNSTRQQSVVRYQTQSVLGSVSLGFKEQFYLDLTGRNDWSSTLAFTPNISFFYYSAGATAVLNELLALPAAIDLAKLRASYAKVGNSVRPFATRPPLYTLHPSTGAMVKNVQAPFPNKPLKPEDNRSFELGTEWRLLKNRLGIDITYYKNDNYDQYFETPAPSGSGVSTYFLNLGHIRNTGIEVMLTIVPVKTADLEWNSAINFASNKNEVIRLSEEGITSGTPQFALSKFDNTYGSVVREGGSFGDMISFVALRDAKGQLVLKANGTPQPGPDREVVGNPNPDFTAGWSNSLRYKQFGLSFLIDGRFGGEVMSLTQAELDIRGFSEASADAREQGGVLVQGVKDGAVFSEKVDARLYYAAIGGRSGIGEFYVYDATAVRLRELSLTYTLPLKGKGIREASFSLVGRNLFYIRRDAPFDPEISMSTGNGLQGLDAFGLPATRSFGLNLKLGF